MESTNFAEFGSSLRVMTIMVKLGPILGLSPNPRDSRHGDDTVRRTCGVSILARLG
ncbi:hypothetical protein Lfu02_23640 [Longispora fulva]|nr:hypothetical protein Lfu02_23640 [Longispora fulva]